ncbi:MAG: hypothetical protein WCP85_18285 [Mariniphaga sp.]
MKYIEILRNILCRSYLLLALIFCSTFLQAQKTEQVITISGSQFANSLVQKWASEYAKEKAGVVFKFVKSSLQNKPTDLKLTVNSLAANDAAAKENFVKVGKIAVLPVANMRNNFFNKQIKNGIRQEELKNIFLQSDGDNGDKQGSEGNGEIPYNVYTQSPQSPTANVLISHFGKTNLGLKGILVTGDDKYLIESVLGDSTGVAYSTLGLLYNLEDRTPIGGIKILPIDPDNNGRLKNEELIYGNLDQLIAFLESSKTKTIPMDGISFSYNSDCNNPALIDFVNWVAVTGQQYNHHFGFLRTNETKYADYSQK